MPFRFYGESFLGAPGSSLAAKAIQPFPHTGTHKAARCGRRSKCSQRFYTALSGKHSRIHLRTSRGISLEGYACSPTMALGQLSVLLVSQTSGMRYLFLTEPATEFETG